MKKVIFNKLEITNFKAINELVIDFKEGTTEIIGQNATGKTSTLSAIMWCLFGKDINDNKLFTISPIIDGKEDNSINTVVRLTINGNYVVERSYKDRKTTLKTGWLIDGKEELVSISQSKYKEELEEQLVDEETFKSLSNINYVPSLHWKELKQLIFDLIGNISDEEVLLRGEFNLIEEYIKKFGIDQTQKLLTDTNKELDTDIKRLETEYQTLVNTKEKYVSSEEENKELIVRKEEIEKELYSNTEKLEEVRKQKEEYDKQNQLVNNLEYEIKQIENSIEFDKKNISDYEELYKSSASDVEELRKRELLTKETEIGIAKNNIENTKKHIAQLQEKMEKTKTDGTTLKIKEIKIENDTCSTCGQPLPKDKIEESLKHLKEEQEKELVALRTKLTEEQLELKVAQGDLVNHNDFLLKLEKELEEIKSKEYVVENESEKQKQLRVAKETKELNVKNNETLLNNKKKTLEEQKGVLATITLPTAISFDTGVLKRELEDINNKLATTITLNKISEDIETTKKELETKKDNKVSNKEKVEQTIKFNNIKADLLQEKVKKYFNLVNFRTKDFTQDGIEVETFKIVDNKNVEFNEINTGHKLLLGIDLLVGIMKAKNIFVPILVDNSEALSSKIEVKETQLILTKVVSDKKNMEVI